MQLLKIKDAADKLSVSQITIRRLVDARELPTVRVAGAVRINLVDLEAYVERQTEGAQP